MLKVLMIGDAERVEMRPIARWLNERGEEVDVSIESGICGPRSEIELGDVDLIVVLEAQPDAYSVDDIDVLFAAAPLARIVCCAGSWSESAGRTRKLWPLAVRVPVHQAMERLEHEWALLTEGRMDSYVPATGSREERFAAHHPPLSSVFRPLTPAAGERARERGNPSTDSPTIKVISPDPAYRQMLADLCTLAGSTTTIDSNSDATIALFDADPWDAGCANLLKQVSESSAIIALTDWQLPEIVSELTSAGARCVLPKLGDQNRILRAIVELIAAEDAPLRRPSASRLTGVGNITRAE